MVTVVNAAVVLAVIALVAAVALVVHPPAPPGIAEFAPQASKPITKAPPGQAGRFGLDGSGCAAVPQGPCLQRGGKGHASAPLGASGSPPGVPSALQCFTWPDGAVTQTFDPQSPPCIASWPDQARGNGGATSSGVTATAIRLAFPQNTSASSVGAMQTLVNFVNTRFELYGRRIVLVPFASSQASEAYAGTSFADPTAQKADASQAAASHVFAATDFQDGFANTLTLATYADTLAAHHVVALTAGESTLNDTDAALKSQAPYEWSYAPTLSDLLQSTATMICRQLAGRPSVHAATYRSTTRKFALVIPPSSVTGGPLAGLSQLTQTLAGCGQKDLPVVTYTNESSDSATLRQAFIHLKADGVTTVLYFPIWGNGNPWDPQPAASSVSYDPEWVVFGWQSFTAASLLLDNPPDETGNTFGVASWNKGGPLPTLPWYQAYLAEGGTPASAEKLDTADGLYHELLLLASGVQMAGPRLTPATFSAALHRTTFPNPGADAAPAYQGRVGFGAGDATMMEDYAAFWLNRQATGAEFASEDQYGAFDFWQVYCYADRGTRWTSTSWPQSDRYSFQNC